MAIARGECPAAARSATARREHEVAERGDLGRYGARRRIHDVQGRATRRVARQDAHLLAARALLLRTHARLEQGIPSETETALLRVWLGRAAVVLDEFEALARAGALFYLAALGLAGAVLRAWSGSLVPGYLAAIAFFAAYRTLVMG